MRKVNERVKQKIDDKKRKRIVSMKKKGWMQEHIAVYFNISEARVSQILSEEKKVEPKSK